MIPKLSAIAALALCLSACNARPVFWDRLETPWALCSAGAPVSLDVEWLNEGRVLRLASEPGAPELRFRGASATDEYYVGDGYRLEIQLGGVIALRRPDGAVLRDC